MSQLGWAFWLEHRQGKPQEAGRYWGETHGEGGALESDLIVCYVFLISILKIFRTEQRIDRTAQSPCWPLGGAQHGKDLIHSANALKTELASEQQPTEAKLELAT